MKYTKGDEYEQFKKDYRSQRSDKQEPIKYIDYSKEKFKHTKFEKEIGGVYNEYFATTQDKGVAEVRDYTGNQYEFINKTLRGNYSGLDKEDHLSTAEAISRVLKDAPRPSKPFKAFRGVEKNPVVNKIYGNLKVGDTYLEKAFTSSSYEKLTSFIKDDSILFEINVNTDTVGAYIGNISKLSHEREFLIDKGTEFKVLEVTTERMKRVFRGKEEEYTVKKYIVDILKQK